MAQHSAQIIGGYALIDQDSSQRINRQTAQYQARLQAIEQLGITPIELTIEPLSSDWHGELSPNNFRSGCAPLMALARAKELIAQGQQAVVIRGDEPLKTGYQRQERHQLMAVYGADYSIAQLYDSLANQFIKYHDIDKAQFLKLSSALFDNHCTSYHLAQQQQRAHFPLPAAKWLHHVTPLFRGVDCANPLVDFKGRLLLCSEQLVAQLQLDSATVEVKGVGLSLLEIDEPTALAQLAQYQHLNLAYQTATKQAGIDFLAQLASNNALVELYSCYPVVPLGFLISCGWIKKPSDSLAFFNQHLVTITGGMNLARAPWNNPALNSLIETYHQLSQGTKQYGLVHGNGGIGYRQGVAILAATPQVT